MTAVTVIVAAASGCSANNTVDAVAASGLVLAQLVKCLASDSGSSISLALLVVIVSATAPVISRSWSRLPQAGISSPGNSLITQGRGIGDERTMS